MHADDPTSSSNSQTQKGRKERNKWKMENTDRILWRVCATNSASFFPPTAEQSQRWRARAGPQRTPIERCKLLLKGVSIVCGRAKIHSPQSGWSGLCAVEQSRGRARFLLMAFSPCPTAPREQGGRRGGRPISGGRSAFIKTKAANGKERNSARLVRLSARLIAP